MKKRWLLSVLLVTFGCGGGGGPVIGVMDTNGVGDLDAEEASSEDIDVLETNAPETGQEVVGLCRDDQDCSSDDPCRIALCDQFSGKCILASVPDFTPCGVASVCDLGGVCREGVCIRKPIDCDDKNPCTVDSCDEARGGCVHEGRTDIPSIGHSTCDDQNPCTPLDICQEGVCVGIVNICPCDSDLECVDKDDGDLCNGTLYCLNKYCVVDPSTVVVCEMGDEPCSPLVCKRETGKCEPSPLPDWTICDDRNACTIGDHCEGGICVGNDVSAAMCDDGNECTDDSCDPAKGCSFVPNDRPCNDGNGCTNPDICKNGKCIGTPTALCGCFKDSDCESLEDGNLCNGTLVCIEGMCRVDTKSIVVCDNSKDTDCQKTVCNPQTGTCEKRPVQNGRPCDDKDMCTLASVCSDGECKGVGSLNCDDGNPCTKDTCNPDVGCVHTAQSGDCDDNNVCTKYDQCVNGICLGTPVICEDGNVCTDDVCHPVVGCIHLPNSAQCDDGSACTEGDRCQGGWCTGSLPANCDDGNVCTDDLCDTEAGCYHVPNMASCDDGNACTEGDTCKGGICTPGMPKECDDQNMCTEDTCDPEKGCIHTPRSGPCDDGDPCTTGDVCVNGKCVGGSPTDCSDGNVCTKDLCEPFKGCKYEPIEGPCDDRDPCTSGDRCVQGLCIATGKVDCSDGNDCTLDSCDAVTGVCIHVPVEGKCEDGNKCTVNDTCSNGTCVPGPQADCDDKNICTTDSCDPMKGCVHVANSLACDDKDACTTFDMCNNGVCVGGPPLNCDDGNPCTKDFCLKDIGCVHEPAEGECDDGNPCTTKDRCVDGVCRGQQVDCNDGNPCTTDVCVPPVGCIYIANSNSCDDQDACTVGDYCQDKVCVGGAPRDCDDHNTCTKDSCDKTIGCIHTSWPDEMPCDDGNACTENDKCVKGKCVGVGLQCDDGNPCTDDRCNATIGCYYVANSNPCDDGNACTLDDRCVNKQCVGQVMIVCDDGNPCTQDFCDPQKGCLHIPVSGQCDDLNACTENDKCEDGKCVGGSPVDCNDDNLCTTDICDPISGCLHLPNNLACDDGNACTVGDQCRDGKCMGGSPANCDDGNVCTTDTCNPATGCIHLYNNLLCDDLNACTNNDMCNMGRCVGTPVTCNDNNVCTTDYCDPAVGCIFMPNDLPCSDGKVCTVGDRCSGGVCVPGPMDTCDDGNVCTDDGCSEPGGCWHTFNTLPCNDGNACTTGDVCSLGVCIGPYAVQCDDNNECTADWCDKVIGCVHDKLPIGTPCGSKYSMCWEGKCVKWEFKTSSYPGSKDTRLYEGGRADTFSDLYASGSVLVTVGSSVVSKAMIFKVTENPIDIIMDHVNPSNGSYFTQSGHVAGGSNGLTSHFVPASSGGAWVEAGAPPFPNTDLLTVFQLSQYAFLAGKALSTGPAVRVCEEDKNYNFKCQPLDVVSDHLSCSKRMPDFRGVWAYKSGNETRLFLAGVEPSLLDWPAAVIATWDGTPPKCPDSKGAGEAVINDPYGLYAPGGPSGPGGLNDVHGLSLSDVWAVGDKGAMYWLSKEGGFKPQTSQWITSSHDIQAVFVDEISGLHMVGVRYTVDLCKMPFYLHGVRVGSGYSFNRYMEFDMFMVCGGDVARLNFADIMVDSATGNIWVFGWVPNNQSNPSGNVALLMRMARPQ